MTTSIATATSLYNLAFTSIRDMFGEYIIKEGFMEDKALLIDKKLCKGVKYFKQHRSFMKKAHYMFVLNCGIQIFLDKEGNVYSSSDYQFFEFDMWGDDVSIFPSDNFELYLKN